MFVKVLHTIGTVSHDSGGPARSVQGLVAALGECGTESSLLSFTPGDCAWRKGVNRFLAVEKTGYIAAIDGMKLSMRLMRPDLIHIHGIWSLSCHAAAVRARKNGVPFVISPRGMLEPWSLNDKKWKKRLALWLYQRRDLNEAFALHATAESEAEQFRRLGCRQPIIILPNGVDFPAAMPPRTHRLNGKRTALFLSRIHPKKGLMELVEAWAEVKGQLAVTVCSGQLAVGGSGHCPITPSSSWHFDYAGPDYDDHLAAVQKRMKKWGVEADFTYLGNLNDTEKWTAYRHVDLFVLPTYSENFGIVVAEALAAGVPVLTTTGTPWKALVERRCGWWIEPGLIALTDALPEVLQTRNEILSEMGERGRRYSYETFAWASIAEQMKRAYAWLLHGGDKPECVRVG